MQAVIDITTGSSGGAVVAATASSRRWATPWTRVARALKGFIDGPLPEMRRSGGTTAWLAARGCGRPAAVPKRVWDRNSALLTQIYANRGVKGDGNRRVL